jgi:hypothetical protein
MNALFSVKSCGSRAFAWDAHMCFSTSIVQLQLLLQLQAEVCVTRTHIWMQRVFVVHTPKSLAEVQDRHRGFAGRCISRQQARRFVRGKVIRRLVLSDGIEPERVKRRLQ